MSRKITNEASRAFDFSENFSKSNTQVRVTDKFGSIDIPGAKYYVTLSLHGNMIAEKYVDDDYRTIAGTRKISNAGWMSNTTKERLNGIFGVRIQQKNFKWFLNDEEWDGNWISI